MQASHATAFVVLVSLVLAPKALAADGNPARGQRVFGACGACHALQPDRNMTGPSLAGVWNRKAGTLPSFNRYSPALKSASIVWNEKTLDAWIEDPQRLVPGNEMSFAGLKDARQRADLLAFLKEATQPGGTRLSEQKGPMRGMSDMMHGSDVPNLKKLDAAQRVRAIAYCKDTYTVTTANGEMRKFWERNLRLKTDSSTDGPEKNAPALVRAGMMGDRADIIFADPGEIGAFVAAKC